MTPQVFAGEAAVFGLWYLVAFTGGRPRILKTLVKTASVGGLAVAVNLVGGPVWLVAALALGAAGDACLTVPTRSAFMAGLLAFAASHIAYIVLFLETGAMPHPLTAWPVAIYGFVMLRQLWVPSGDLRWPVAFYVAVISVMGMAALMLPEPFRPAIFAAFAFVLSDSLLAKEIFVWPEGHPARRWSGYAVWALYWGAQAGFAWVFALGAAF